MTKGNNMERIHFSEWEITQLAECPEALAALADVHAVRETMADASDWAQAAKYHADRAQALRQVADYIGLAHDNGDAPVFGPTTQIFADTRSLHEALATLVFRCDEYANMNSAGNEEYRADTKARYETALEAAKKLAKAPLVSDVVPEFTDAIETAVRPLFLALECNMTQIEDVRHSFEAPSRKAALSLLPKWFREGRGHLTKDGRAQIAWHLMYRAYRNGDRDE